MKTVKIIILFVMVFNIARLSAADIHIKDINLKYAAGVSASAMYFDNPGFLRRHDSYILNDVLVEISPAEKHNDDIQFYAGFGLLQKQSINRISAPLPPVDIGLQYGWLHVPTYRGRHIEIGHLVTKLGLESSVSYQNQHALMGAIYSAQPSHYSGVRFNGPLGPYQYYIEVTNDPTIGDASAAIGITKKSAHSHLSISYYEAIDERKMIDIVFSKKISHLSLGVNVDYHALESVAVNQDKNALGIAFYTMYKSKKWNWPLRLEYINDGNTGIYQYDKGYTLTFTPSYQLRNKQTIRAELIYAKADGSPFRNSNRGLEDSQWIATLQVISLF